MERHSGRVTDVARIVIVDEPLCELLMQGKTLQFGYNGMTVAP